MRPLWPPLKTIEQELFNPSDALIQRWIHDHHSLSPELQQALEADPAARELRSLLQTERPEHELEIDPDALEILEMPESLRELLDRRTAARQASRSAIPAPGQILLIEQIIGPGGRLDLDLAKPLAVLISEPTETDRVWYGWLAASETDYAGYWDFVLQSDADEPFDPLAGMVQTWNPVYVYIPSTSAVLAELRPERLAAVRALALDYALGPAADPASAIPGRVALREVNGFQIITGTPLSSPEDPRWRYQELYHAIAEAVREPARLAMRASAAHTEPASLHEYLHSLGERLRAWAEDLGLSWQPVPPVAHAMGDSQAQEPVDYLLDNRLRLTLIGRETGDEPVLELHLHLEHGEPVQIIQIEEGDILNKETLTPDAPKVDLRIEPDQPCTLEVRDSAGHLLYQIPFSAG